MTTARVVLAGLAAALLLLGCGNAGAAGDDEPLLVAAAADLMPAFTALGESFEGATGEQVTFNFGSSGQLAQQLIEGSPMDLYAAANVEYVDRVVAAGVGDPDTQATYAHGRLVIWSADDDRGWVALDDLVRDETVRTIAIANPEHAPYGLAAQQAFEAQGLWEEVRPRLVYGENVSDTQRMAAGGDADAAVIALSLALAADERGEGRWSLVPEDAHAPLQQDLLVVATDPDRAEGAEAFIDYVSSEEGRDVMRRYGFLLPGEDPPSSWEP